VVDRAKGVTLHSLASVLLGSQSRDGQQAVQLITAEEAGVRHGASIMVHGTKVTKGGAAFANAEMAMAGGKLDSFRMLTHPGTSIVPGAFVAAETAASPAGTSSPASRPATRSWSAGSRLHSDVMARGFHAGPVFGIFGPPSPLRRSCTSLRIR
jgi:2-methylcitrate dehydratase PrpD